MVPVTVMLLYCFQKMFLCYYLGVPQIVRGDCGSENVCVEAIQKALRYNHTDSMSKKPFLYGKSVNNQVSFLVYLMYFIWIAFLLLLLKNCSFEENRKVMGISQRDEPQLFSQLIWKP